MFAALPVCLQTRIALLLQKDGTERELLIAAVNAYPSSLLLF